MPGAVVGLLTPRLDQAAPSRPPGEHRFSGAGLRSNGVKKRLIVVAWSQRRGRPGFAPEFPVRRPQRQVPQPTTNARDPNRAEV